MSKVKTTSSYKKKKIAVFFGGRSPEHDVSVVSGLQVLKAIDASVYDAFPVYITTDGQWLVGDVLRDRKNFLLDKNARNATQAVTLGVNSGKSGRLIPLKGGLLGAPKPIEFDVALPIFHGLTGEDGNIQGLFEVAGVPYGGMRTLASSVLMDKLTTKYFLQGLGIPTLPFAAIRRPDEGYLIANDELAKMLGELKFPCIIKPVHLGSSIGVAKVNNMDELAQSLPAIFEYDDSAIVEPFVENLVEYNVSVAKMDGRVVTSAIERPKAVDELLDFKQKYLSSGDNKSGTKTPGQSSEGMLSLTREINPELPDGMDEDIHKWAIQMFSAIDGSGVPRIDFISNSKSGEIWMNEVNPCPGSLGYFLWEAAKEPLLFTELLSFLINEAASRAHAHRLPKDPVPLDARLLRRPV